MKKLLTVCIALFFPVLVHGQVETKSFPGGDALINVDYLYNNALADKLITMPTFDIEKLIEEDELRDGSGVPYRFGYGFDVSYSLGDGSWVDVEGGRLWSLGFTSKGAKTLNFVLDKLNLPYGAELYICNGDRTVLYGPVTSEQRITKGVFLTDLVEGETATLYLFEPAVSKGMSVLGIARVVHGYRSDLITKGFQDSDYSCQNDIKCYPAWADASDAVALVILADGESTCSGSLIMSADASFRPYFLSAYHCIDDNQNGNISDEEISDSESWAFKFQYKMATCDGSTATTATTYNGATYRAAWYDTDFALFELTSLAVTSNPDLSWLGWDRSGDIPISGTGIHHPMGDVMKISFDNDAPFKRVPWLHLDGLQYPPYSHWQIEFDSGVMLPGSSGSPLLNSSQRIVGQFHGAYYAAKCPPQEAYYGCFDGSWTGDGTNDGRLSNWLDPQNSGQTKTFMGRCGYPISGPSILCSTGGSYYISGVEGAVIRWLPGTGVQRISADGSNPCIFSAALSGRSSTIGAMMIYNNDTTMLKPAKVWIGGPPTPTIIPSSNVTTVMQGYYYTVPQNTYNVFFQMDYNGEWYINPSLDDWSYSGVNNMYDYGQFLDMTTYNLGENYVIGSQYNSCPGASNVYFTVDVVQDRSSGSGEAELTLSPNPAIDFVEVTVTFDPNDKEPADYTLEIIDGNSAVIRSMTLSGTDNRVNVQDLRPGYYIVRVLYGKTILTKTLIIG